MNDLFIRWIFDASVQIAVLVIVIAAIVWFGRRLSARLRYALWTLVLIKALLPPFFAVPWSVANQAFEPMSRFFAQQNANDMEQTAEQTAVSIPVIHITDAEHDAGHEFMQEVHLQKPSETMPVVAVSAPLVAEQKGTRFDFPYLFGVWLAGALFVWGVILYHHALAVRRLQKGRQLDDGPICELLGRLTKRLQLKTMPRIILSDAVRSPFLWGFSTPCIAIPADFPGEVSASEMESVLLHELTHWKRGDLIVARFESLVQGLFWFHPAVWLAIWRLRLERESACDEAVLNSGCVAAKQYGDSLLSVMVALREKPPVRVGFLGFIGILERKTQLQKRLEEIMSQQRRVKRIGLFGWGFLLFLTLCVLPMAIAQNNPQKADPPKTEEKPVAEKQVEIPVKSEGDKTPDDRIDAAGINMTRIEAASDSTVMITRDEQFHVAGGVIIDPRGFIVTNGFVIEGLDKILVKTHDGHEYIAINVGYDPNAEIALIKITPSKPLVPIRIGDSSRLRILDRIIVLGHPFGYSYSFSSGEIMGLDRKLSINENSIKYGNMIQISADINPGNAGGPLLTTGGEMIGLNTAVRREGRIAFALPSDYVMEVAAGLLDHYTSQSCRHGIHFKEVDVKLIGTPNIHVDDYKILVVASVDPDSPAQEAGLLAGDILRMSNNLPLDRKLDFYRTLVDKNDGDVIPLVFERNGSRLETNLSLKSPKH